MLAIGALGTSLSLEEGRVFVSRFLSERQRLEHFSSRYSIISANVSRLPPKNNPRFPPMSPDHTNKQTNNKQTKKQTKLISLSQLISFYSVLVWPTLIFQFSMMSILITSKVF